MNSQASQEHDENSISSVSVMINEQSQSDTVIFASSSSSDPVANSITTIKVHSLEDTTEQTEKALKALDWVQVCLFLLVILSDSVSINIVLPFVPDFARERFNTPEEDLGTVSGLIVGVFLLFSFLSSLFLGSLSDYTGRKPLISLGLFTSTICTFLFPLVPNLGTALALRGFAGLTNANIVLSFSGLSDISKGPARSIVFAYLGGTFALGRSLSSFLGGITVGIHLNFLPDGKLWSQNDYLLPCIIGASFNAISLLFIVLFLKESNKPDESQRRSFLDIIKVGVSILKKDFMLQKLAWIYWVHSFCNGAMIFLIILYLALDISHKGFGFAPLNIGILLGIFGITGAIYQLSFAKKVIYRFGVRRTYQVGLLLLAVSTISFPVAGSLSHISFTPVDIPTHPVVWAMIIFCCMLMGVGFMNGLPILSSIVSNVIPKTHQGTLQGFVRSFASLSRACGPFVSGAFFSLFTSIHRPGLTYIFMFLGYSLCLFVFSKLNDPRFTGLETEEPKTDAENLST